MRGCERDTVGRSMVAERPGIFAVELEIIGADAEILLAQVFGENAPDFAIADQADMPLVRTFRHIVYWTLMFAAFNTGPHLSASACMNLSKSAGEEPTGV